MMSGYHGSTSAPIFEVPERKIVAVEHPCILRNLDNGLNAFGPDPNFRRLIDDVPEPMALPLWFRPDNPASKPIISHHAATNNVLLKITVPRRTGRKRKRGSGDPFSGDVHLPRPMMMDSEANVVGSVDRRDSPRSILRKMQDNVDNHEVEAIGLIRDSHRYRGLADFQFASTDSPFLNKVAEHLLPMKLSKLREFRLEPGVATAPGQEIIPPPHFTDKVIGFNYNYEQNPTIRDDGGENGLVNTQGRKQLSYGHFIHHNHFPAPEQPKRPRDGNHGVPDALLSQLDEAMERRPVWTRRSILNQVHGKFGESIVKIAIQLVGYQFRGGPWRDSIVKYGVDPRVDPEHRQYQTLSFKLERNIAGKAKTPWQTIRKGQTKIHNNTDRNSHSWDGESYSTDGKFWQVCDITDPFMLKLIEEAPLRTECDVNESGWFHRGTWNKVKAAMRVKMFAISKGKMGSEDDNPQKKGYLYNSFLAAKLAMYPDVSDKPFTVAVEGLLRPLEELEGRIRSKRRPDLPKAPKRWSESGAAYSPTSPRGDRHGQDEDSDDLFVANAPRSPTGNRHGQDDELAQFDSDGLFVADDQKMDNAWDHILDSDLDGGDPEAENDDQDGYGEDYEQYDDGEGRIEDGDEDDGMGNDGAEDADGDAD
ncbi:Uu.00g094470.m01.CDS01 [Anthostomella pinea]|uniref:Uu.00g094470.m01.CDS01 n=1 Tax=Anthostomella pinea TaxID=933095 RepID=A0AAI8VPL4_9PEZI|nr:Uu.00g094470.m01.CDS01 [Anthostomella pinea]